MERIRLNLDSIAMMLFCARLKAYKEVPLTTDEWLTIEKIIKKKGFERSCMSAFNVTKRIGRYFGD